MALVQFTLIAVFLEHQEQLILEMAVVEDKEILATEKAVTED